jgi:hypothetical protein
MISVQLGISVTDALVTLRASAYAKDRPIAQLAADVVGRRLSFSDGSDGSGGHDGFPDGGGPGKTGEQPHVDGSDNNEEMEGNEPFG